MMAKAWIQVFKQYMEAKQILAYLDTYDCHHEN